MQTQPPPHILKLASKEADEGRPYDDGYHYEPEEGYVRIHDGDNLWPPTTVSSFTEEGILDAMNIAKDTFVTAWEGGEYGNRENVNQPLTTERTLRMYTRFSNILLMEMEVSATYTPPGWDPRLKRSLDNFTFEDWPTDGKLGCKANMYAVSPLDILEQMKAVEEHQQVYGYIRNNDKEEIWVRTRELPRWVYYKKGHRYNPDWVEKFFSD